MAMPLRQKVLTVLLLLYWPGLFVLAHVPIPRLVYRAQVSDKTLHFLAHLLLVFLLWFAVRPDRKVSWRDAALWWVLFVAVWYGAFDELLQGGSVGRSCDFRDFLANLAGASSGLVVFSLFAFWPALLAVTGATIFLLTNLARMNPAELLPITSVLFYFLAYGFFTLLWIKCLGPVLSIGVAGLWQLATAFSLPVALLAAAKVFSVVLDKSFTVRSVAISAAGITVAAAAAFALVYLRRRPSHDLSPNGPEGPV